MQTWSEMVKEVYLAPMDGVEVEIDIVYGEYLTQEEVLESSSYTDKFLGPSRILS